ncbi:uncharacterized protein LOC133285832 [Gastrolobium bilobum]|uniref:uncharacterized protein LOC133285832 n=1 Tax=Gastrolobium bilobum TaxID=150636 RepID=UPI002AB16EEE|nr:uncharacterized protein LOC133285832 [Gastrolobium bilobum]XP_061339115.1 uncharacterized protein LOC133285832 [Gastrolobium bilobum]XP_061339123.1 uncharacterized protein LOC133285832 [Gastrolobium bilobum]XP_061339132.1 uncharacterized protein LOC133285832 [Gastrolobium bilobum]
MFMRGTELRYGEKSDGLVTCRDAEVPGSVVVRPNRKLDHAWMVYSSKKKNPSEPDAREMCEALLTLLVELASNGVNGSRGTCTEDGTCNTSGTGIQYEDFFGGKKEKGLKRKAQESEDSGDEDDMEFDEQKKGTASAHEKQLENIHSKMEQMEKANIEPKTWTM